jgi:hypothetical protein
MRWVIAVLVLVTLAGAGVTAAGVNQMNRQAACYEQSFDDTSTTCDGMPDGTDLLWRGLLIGMGGVLALTLGLPIGSVIRAEIADGRLRRTGVRTTAEVVAIRATGLSVNDNPRVRLTVRVCPAGGGPPFESTTTTLVPHVAIPRVGDHVEVFYDPANPSRAALAEQPETPAGVANGVTPADSPITGTLDELTRLAALRDRGALTTAEYETLKQRLIEGA